MSKTLVLFHANCADGFASAWIAHRKFGDDAEYIPVQYGQEPPDVANDKDRPLYILDFSYSRNVMFRLAALRHAEMIVLDHHKTAQAALDGLEIELAANNCGDALTAHFDMGKSGARLSWEFFFSREPIPYLVRLVEDRDLWRWKLPDSREFSAAIASYPKTFEVWDRLGKNINEPRCECYDEYGDSLIEQGSAILRYQQQLVDSACENATEIEMDGHKVLSVNSTVLFSEIAGKLAENRPFGAAYFIRADGKKQWSLRSRDEGVDVSEVAKRHGGGGHRNAAGWEEDQ